MSFWNLNDRTAAMIMSIKYTTLTRSPLELEPGIKNGSLGCLKAGSEKAPVGLGEGERHAFRTTVK